MSTTTQEAPKLGKYLLLKKLGGGGMGRVYLASMSGPMAFEKKVVVKTILPSYTESKDYVQLFLNEARLGARLSHSAIASIHELGEENGLYYLVMEYVDGWTLKDAIKAAQKAGRTLNPARVAEIFARVCEGLYYAHTLTDKDGRALGVVHRDLSPQNIMISREGDVKIIDFGVARSDLSGNETVAGTIKGKLSYMSPEQSRGERVDARSDVFALGVLLYESLTNTNPFNLDSPISILRAIETLEPPPLARLDQNLGPFDAIIRRCLQKEKDRRYPDCRELRMDLLAVLERARASQRDHLGAWFASILDGKVGDAPSTSGPPLPENTMVEKIDLRGGPRDPGEMLPDPGEEAPIDEQATRLKPAGGAVPSVSGGLGAGGTVIRPAGAEEAEPPPYEDEDDGTPSHVTGLQRRPSRAPLFVGLAAVLVVGGAVAFVALRPSSKLPDVQPPAAPVAAAPPPAAPAAAQPPPSTATAPSAPAAPAPAAVQPTAVAAAAPVAPPAAPAAALPTQPAPEAPAAALPPVPSQPVAVADLTDKGSAPAPADAVPPDVEPAHPEASSRRRGRRHHASDDAPTPAAAAPVAAGGIFVKPIGDTHAADARGNPITSRHGFGSNASLQIGNLLVHLTAQMRDGERILSISSEPWAIASVDGVSRGKTPVASIPLPDDGVRLELIRPGMDSAAVLKISPSNH